MKLPEESVLLRIYVGEEDHVGHQPLYEYIVLKAKEKKLAGATVLHGKMGFGHSSHLHTAKILRLSEDLPIIIEIVDAKTKIEKFLKEIEIILSSSLVTIERVTVLRYGNSSTEIK